MTGWRLGCIATRRDYVAAIETMHYYTVACPPTPIQWAGVAALEGPQDQADMEGVPRDGHLRGIPVEPNAEGFRIDAHRIDPRSKRLLRATTSAAAASGIKQGQQAQLWVDTSQLQLFDHETGRSLLTSESSRLGAPESSTAPAAG